MLATRGVLLGQVVKVLNLGSLASIVVDMPSQLLTLLDQACIHLAGRGKVSGEGKLDEDSQETELLPAVALHQSKGRGAQSG